MHMGELSATKSRLYECLINVGQSQDTNYEFQFYSAFRFVILFAECNF